MILCKLGIHKTYVHGYYKICSRCGKTWANYW